ncbi:MAG TPA: hypothetical protein PK325_19375 [Cyclobacteriaceae bacterium]|nr:hypothetical protein [Cyclobacteriaceae bacterium]HMV09571.1 hypothetical protein [Cyclobacteriaceae bacterium]HMV90487.1 hypothetical protein [Cyclobacteriaceae bacterium]HMX01966.1 hypothetical protein [Cyclobacteriaceae bacterium]HMX51835.1 hypothetical protein [Cyclobacteriaceae bacterium]
MILALVLLYLVGKTFYTLAEKHHKNKWLFAILGIVSYYAGILIGSLGLGIVLGLASPETLNTMSDGQATLIAIPIGIVSCWGFYRILKRSWSRATTKADNGTLDSGFISNTDELPGHNGQNL